MPALISSITLTTFPVLCLFCDYERVSQRPSAVPGCQKATVQNQDRNQVRELNAPAAFRARHGVTALLPLSSLVAAIKCGLWGRFVSRALSAAWA